MACVTMALGQIPAGRGLGYRRVMLALLLGVVVPVALATAVGIVSVAQGEGASTLVIGVLVISFAATAGGGVITAALLLRRRARIARMQADLLANISHELKTPLSSIRMLAQTLLAEDGDLAERRECLQSIERQTRWLESMIERVLTWRASSTDRGGLECRPAPLAPAIRKAVERYQQMVEPGEVALEVSLDEDLVAIHDPAAVEAVVINLLINAYKYTPTDKHIRVGLHDRAGQVEVSVSDNGIGIEPAEQMRIFEPFYRADSGLQARAAGTGLGLAIVRHLVVAQGGRVGVESNPGQGSRFFLLLPRAVKGEAAP